VRRQARKRSSARFETCLEPCWDKLRGRLSLPDTRATTGTFVLELEGESVPVKSIEGWAAVGVVVIAAPSAGSRFREKHLSGVRFEPIVLAASSRRPHRLFEWITTAWKGTLAQKSGAAIRVDLNGRPLAKREFVKAILVETTVPLLDATSNSTADFTVRLAPERTTDVNPPTTLPPAGTPTPGDAAFMSPNFRLSIVGLDCNRISKIESFTVKQTPGTGLPEFPNLRIELSDISAATWRSWFQSFLLDSGAANEKTGTLSFLNANLTTVLVTINFSGLGIFRLENAPADASRVVAELYCERMELTIPTG
jgi:hypothetical protein